MIDKEKLIAISVGVLIGSVISGLLGFNCEIGITAFVVLIGIGLAVERDPFKKGR